MKLYYFSRREFLRDGRDWFDDIDPRLLVLLDTFRHQWGSRVLISGHPDAIGRTGKATDSQHHWEPGKLVRGIDVIPSAMGLRKDANRAITMAIDLGFTGIGLYPHWQPSAGLHLDTRTLRRPGDPALWGAVYKPQQYLPLNETLEFMPA
jgi:hypothetical protein